MTTQYARGRKVEYETIDMLKGKGWWTIRAAGSHGPVDIIAARFRLDPYNPAKSSRRLAMQVKKGRSPFGDEDRKGLLDAAMHLDAVPILAMKRKVKGEKKWRRDFIIIDSLEMDDRPVSGGFFD